MTPEEHKMLAETRALVEETAAVVRRMQKAARVNMAIKAAYWIAIALLSFGAYYLIQPYVDTLKDSVSQLQGLY